MKMLLFIVPFIGIIALIYAFFKTISIKSAQEGDEKMKRIGKSIADGA